MNAPQITPQDSGTIVSSEALTVPDLGMAEDFVRPEIMGSVSPIRKPGFRFACVPNGRGLTANGDRRCLCSARAVFGKSTRRSGARTEPRQAADR